MSATVSGLDSLLPSTSLSPAAAAAILVLNQVQPLTPDRLARGLAAVAPHLSEAGRADWIQVLPAPLRHAAITTTDRVATFLGQCAVESGGFRLLEEDLNYSAARLCVVWPSHFPNQAAAEPCAMNPERLASTVYANRLGNGDSESGDGWRFRGLIQMTGRDTYQQFAKAMGIALDAAVDHGRQRCLVLVFAQAERACRRLVVRETDYFDQRRLSGCRGPRASLRGHPPRHRSLTCLPPLSRWC